MTQVLALLFAAAFTYVVSLGAGKLLLQTVSVKLYRSEEYFFGFVLGSAVLSTVVFLLTAAGLAYTQVFLAAGVAIISAAAWRGAYRFSSDRLPALEFHWKLGLALLYATFALVYLRSALLPEVGSDALAYHIALPVRYLREHHFPPSLHDMMANLSEGVELLYLFALAFGKTSAGAMVHLTYALVLPLGMLSWGRRAGLPMVGAVGGLLVFMAPIVGKLATTAYIDVAAACVVFAVFYVLDIWRKDQSNTLLVPVGILAGFCYAAKYTAGVAVPYALALILFHCLRGRKPWLRSVVVAGVCAAVMMAPYLVKNVVYTGNPVSPFANQLFPNPLLTPSLERAYAYQMRHWLGVHLVEVPLEVTIRGGRLSGIVGPVFLLLPLCLLALRSPVGRRVLLAGAVFAIPYFSSIATRFLIPSLPFFALALACVFSRWKPTLAALVLVHAILSWPRVVPQYCSPYCWRLERAEWNAILRRQPEPEFLRSHMGDYDIGREMDRNVPPGQAIFALEGMQQTYYSRDVIVGWKSAFGDRLRTAILTPLFEGMQPVWHYQFDLPRKTTRGLRLLQRGSSPQFEWSVAELRVFAGGVELARDPQWRLSASHNPWDVQMAFDNNPVTRWTSGDRFRPGMWVQVDFGKEQAVESVLAECSSDQPETLMRLEFEDARGHWTESGGEPSVSRRRAPPDLRHAATAALKSNQVYWLLTLRGDAIAEDIAGNPKAWGLRLVTSSGDYRLYAIE